MIVKNYKIWFSLSAIIIAIGIIMGFIKGLNFGIDFVGGTSLAIEMKQEFDKAELERFIKEFDKDAVVNKAENTQLEVRSKNLNSEKVSEILSSIKEKYSSEAQLLYQDEIGESIGAELTTGALIALIISSIFMLLYVAIRFEIKFGIAAILTLIHDVSIVLSAYAIFSIPLNSPFIAAILTIIGYSINDTIVVFDRVRENLRLLPNKSPIDVANNSLKQTYIRCLNTSLTTLVFILAIYWLVPSIREFSLPIFVGVLAGTYSSIFIATPLWVVLKGKNNTNNKKTKRSSSKISTSNV